VHLIEGRFSGLDWILFSSEPLLAMARYLKLEPYILAGLGLGGYDTMVC
jgi:hypothetical protein